MLRRVIAYLTDTLAAGRNASRGFILMTCYGLLSVMMILSFAIFSRSTSFLQSAERNQNRIIAFNMAETGIDTALSALELSADYAGTGFSDALSDENMQGGFEVTVTTPDGFENLRLIRATGYAPSNDSTERAYETRTIEVYAEIGEQSYFDFAVFAKDGLQLNGNARVDSYNSNNGPYNPNNPGTSGDIGTDSTGAHTVMLAGNVQILGDAQVGPAGDPDSVIIMSGNSEITGESSAAPAPRDYDPATTEIPSSGDLRLSGRSVLELAAGTYHYDSIKISGQAQLAPLGPITIYVDGSAMISGNGIATSDNSPPNLLLYGTGTGTIKITGNGDFYGGIYAPHAFIQNSGNGDIYGAVVAQNYHQAGNGEVHYDESLQEAGGDGNAGLTVKSWREENTAAWDTGTA